MLAAVPVPWAVIAWSFGPTGADTPAWALVLLGISTVALLLGALTTGGSSRKGRLSASIGLIALPVLAAPRITESPGMLLFLTAGTLLGIASLWKLGGSLFSQVASRSYAPSGRLRGSAATSLAFWLVVGIGEGREDPQSATAVGLSLLVSMLVGVHWLFQRRHTANPRTRTIATAAILSVGLVAIAHSDLWSLASCGAVYSLIAAVFGPRTERYDPATSRWWNTLLEHPERMLVASFATLASVGSVVLALPQSSVDPSGIRGIDAVFTAVSAACVTGLTVRDTAADFTAFGQAALLLLIQLGGIGIMTFSTVALRVLGARLSLRQESAVATLFGTGDRSRIVTSAQDVLRVTFLIEGVGAVLLTVLFLLHGSPFGTSCWHGLFTSVSAFCNAGFAMDSQSLVPYQDDPMILHTTATLIILGGLSPAVLLTLRRRRNPALRMPARVKLCVVATVLLLFSGFLLFLAVEWNGVLDGLSIGDKLNNAWFQSATLRTAGFNSVAVPGIHSATYVMMLLMMFIGGCPGGTAGGIKTTTVAVLLLSVLQTIRGRATVIVFGRSIPEGVIRRAAVIVTIAIASGVCALLLVLLTQEISMSSAVFEVTSALGTVGLSQGATAQLDDIGKVIIFSCMFVGRIGGLSIMMIMSQRTTSPGITLPTERIDVG